MANITRLTDNLFTGGDLPPFAPAHLEHIDDWAAAGITHVIDNRIEWTDESLVAEHAPAIVYLHNGVDDAGQQMPDSSFDDGVAFALEAMARSDTAVLTHCHMGINRGPSLALAILLAQGWDVIEALDHIRGKRPIAMVRYAEDALAWWHRHAGSSETARSMDHRRLVAWRQANRIDLAEIIGKIRRGGQRVTSVDQPLRATEGADTASATSGMDGREVARPGKPNRSGAQPSAQTT